jgi:O-antigen ligase
MPDKALWHARLFKAACALTVVFPVLLPSAMLADIALCIIAASFLAHCFMQKEWGWLKESWARTLLLLWLYMIARGLFAEHPKEALSRGLPFARYLVFAAALARWTLADIVTRRRFFGALSGFVIFCAGDGLLQYVTGDDLLGHPLIHDPHNGHIRLSGPFTRPVLGIMLAWLAFPALLPALLARKGNRLATLAGMFAVLAAVALSGERMALLLTLLGCGLAAVLLRLQKKALCAGFLSIILLLGALAFLSPDMFERQVASTRGTLEHWQESPYGMLLKSDLALAAEHPVTGLGAGHFKSACEALYPDDAAKIAAMCNTHPHNIYLEWLIEEGITGLTLFVVFVSLVLKDGIGIFLRREGNPAFAGLFVAFALRVWPFMSTTGFFSRWGAPPFWLALGALLVYTQGKGAKNAGASIPFQDSGL